MASQCTVEPAILKLIIMTERYIELMTYIPHLILLLKALLSSLIKKAAFHLNRAYRLKHPELKIGLAMKSISIIWSVELFIPSIIHTAPINYVFL